jgi:hypothetical protein
MKYLNDRRTVLLVTLLSSVVIDVGASWAIGHIELGSTARIAVALSPVPAKIAVIAFILQAIRRLDEFQKRVHFEAVTVAFLSTGVAVIVYGYLEKAQAAGPLNMGLVWTFMVFFYAIGYFIAKVHYK